MQILWYEGFETYGAIPITAGTLPHLTEGAWAEASGGDIETTVKRTGTYAFQGQGGWRLRRSLGGDFEYVGTTFGFYMTALPILSGAHILGQFRDVNNNPHVGLEIGTTGRISAFLGGYDKNLAGSGTLLGISQMELAPGTFNTIEHKAHIHPSAGSVKVRVNGRDFLSITGINTVGPLATNTLASQIAWGYYDGSRRFDFSITNGSYVDDIVAIHFADDGSEDATFLGQYGVYYLKPTADDVTFKDWSLTTGVNGWALINDVNPDDNLNFIFADSAGEISAFTVEPLPVNIVSVASIAPFVRTEKTDTGNADLQLGFAIGGAEYDSGGDFAITTSWTNYSKPMDKNPATMAAWDPLALPKVLAKRTG